MAYFVSNSHICCLVFVIVLFVSIVVSDSKWKYPGRSDTRLEDVTLSCGLSGDGLTILAIGDFNSDRYDDYFILSDEDNSVCIYLWNKNDFKFEPHSLTKVKYDSHIKVMNVIPSDYNKDGRLDVLISFKDTRDSIGNNTWHHEIYFGTYDGWEEEDSKKKVLKFTSIGQLTLLDMNGTFNVDLFGQSSNRVYGFYSPHTTLKDQKDFWTLLPSCPLNSQHSKLLLSEYHSSAFVDIDGDGRSDLLVPCEDSESTNSISLMIFLNSHDLSSLKYHSMISLSPKPISTLSFGDFDGNGSIDMIYASSDGLHVFFNKQRLYCHSSKDVSDNCKNRKHRLFEHDTSFGYDTETINNPFRLDISNYKLFNSGLRIRGSDNLNAPVSLHICDIQYDGYPDIACIVTTGKSNNSTIVVLKNVPIQGKPDLHAHRTFTVDDTITKMIPVSTSPWAVSFVDLANDGVMDIISNTKDHNMGTNKIVALRSMYYVDAFFINIVVTNGVCHMHCPTGERNPRPKPYGVNYPGASFKFSYVDIEGYHRVHMGAQYFQSGRMTLMSPSQYLGLGRTNTFVEFFAISTPTKALNEANWTNVIPNSNLIAFPPYDSDSHWILELHINPSEYVKWISVALISCLLVLATIVLILRKSEVYEDRKERKKALHAINFDAL